MNNSIMLPTRDALASDIEAEVKASARKILALAKTKNKKLSTEQAAELAVFCWLNDLNPANDEAYYVPGIGATFGIRGIERKAAEALEYEAGRPGNTWQVEYRPAEPGEADFNPDAGDIAYVCTLTDSVSEGRWLMRSVEIMAKLKQAGFSAEDAERVAREQNGPRPAVQAVGVVYASETFSGRIYVGGQPTSERKPEMFDRHERAKKRARKQCLRQRFPRVELPAREVLPEIDAQRIAADISVIDGADAAPVDDKSAAKLLSELGYDPREPIQQQADIIGAEQPPVDETMDDDDWAHKFSGVDDV